MAQTLTERLSQPADERNTRMGTIKHRPRFTSHAGTTRVGLVIGVLASGASGAAARDASLGQPADGHADKSSYHLFNPTPRELLRDMSTDRPDATESPFTVDAGHVQLEMSFVDLAFEGLGERGGSARTAASVAPMLLKVGVLNDIDVQLGIDPLLRVPSDSADADPRHAQGFGDSVLRVKVNLWGNDGGATALALMPFVVLPTATGGVGAGGWEGGLIVPLAVALDEHWTLGLMGEADFVRSGLGDDLGIDLVHTATLSCPLGPDSGCFVEYAGFENLDGDERYRGFLNLGMTWGLTGDVQFDAGVRVGLTDAAEDFGFFTGVSFRF